MKKKIKAIDIKDNPILSKKPSAPSYLSVDLDQTVDDIMNDAKSKKKSDGEGSSRTSQDL